MHSATGGCFSKYGAHFVDLRVAAERELPSHNELSGTASIRSRPVNRVASPSYRTIPHVSEDPAFLAVVCGRRKSPSRTELAALTSMPAWVRAALHHVSTS